MTRRLALWLATLGVAIGLALAAWATTSTSLNVAISVTHVGVFDNSGSPYGFTTLVPAINYNTGGQGIGYNAAPPAVNNPCNTTELAYRSDCVNFKRNAFSGSPAFAIGYNVQTGWYKYAITVASAVPSYVNLQVAANSPGGSWAILIDGTQVATITTPNTGSYDVFQTAASGVFTPPAGNHTLELYCNGGDQYNGCGDILTWQGVVQPTQTIQSVSLSCGTSCSFGTGAAGTIIGTASAVMNPASPSFSGSFSLSTSAGGCNGTNGAQNGNFSFSGANLVTANTDASGPNAVCILASQTGSASVGLPVTLTGTTGFSCDQGPTATSIPAPAQAAGFTKCLLNADFTSSSYTNPANWLQECGYGGSASNTTFRLIENNVPGSHVQSAPCNRAVMTTDMGSQVLELDLYQNDYAVNGFDILELDWPTDAYTAPQGPNGVGLQHAQYAEVTYRMPQASAQESGGRQFLPYAFWYNGSPGLPTHEFVEVDFFEIYSNICGINGGAPANTCDYAFNVNLYGVTSPTPNVPVGPAYTQSGFLTTTADGVHFALCMYTNGGIATHTPQVCVGPANFVDSVGPVGTVDPRYGLLENWLNNDCGGTPGCNLNTITVYIQSIKLWGCPNYWNGLCTGTVINSAIEGDTKFAERRKRLRHWVADAVMWLENLVLPSAYAQ